MESSVKELASHRINRAFEDLEVAKKLLDDGSYRISLNRSYYAIFHAIRAINSLEGFDSSKHSGVISFFNLHYIKTGIFDKSLSQIIRKASKYREQADYEDFFDANEEDASEVYALANTFVSTIKSKLIEMDILPKADSE